ncbi:MAG: restriction endonuclease subunit S [Chloroflexi bacterium]|nr:restriction endonuclease subunit S [Chloroflexota bacterium]
MTVDECITIIDYRGRTPPYVEEGIPHLRSSNIRNGEVKWEGLKFVTDATYQKYMTRGIPQQGDALCTEAPLGEVAPIPKNIRFSLAQRIMILRPNKKLLDHKFLMFQIMSQRFQNGIKARESGTVVAGISSRNFRSTPIYLPPLLEQERIVAEIEKQFTRLDQAVVSLRRLQTNLSRYKASSFVKRISPQIADNYRRTCLQGGEVLITVRGTLGGIVVVPEECKGYNISREVAMIALVNPQIGPAIQYFVAAQPIQNWLNRRTRGIAYTGINIETLKQMPVPLPPLAEQHRIVAEVERRLSVITATEQAITTNLARAERLRQSILHRAFTGQLV